MVEWLYWFKTLLQLNTWFPFLLSSLRYPATKVFMSDPEVQTIGCFDPFTDVSGENSGPEAKENILIRVQQHDGRKSLVTCSSKKFSYNKILTEFCCNGHIVQDPELGNNRQGIAKEFIKIHGICL
ncbi:hypothetical protein V6N12_063904 [Hibiscus sabdariffa]|uniref:SUI1 domain-containing protein n=1 Tax=Hibiscus sabdariffa TaxID=183260 RepID=A0ABR2ARJ2_9ROSI